uniref:Uncharacterized protein n=1 Tax=viral metagenome TaxID=1070528 RepID=A0A6C0KDE6_9ZZZZ
MTNTENKKALDVLLRKLCDKLKDDRDSKKRQKIHQNVAPPVLNVNSQIRRLDYQY